MCVCVLGRCVCVLSRCVCVLSRCVCVFSMCVCVLIMCVCVLGMCAQSCMYTRVSPYVPGCGRACGMILCCLRVSVSSCARERTL